MNIGNSAELTNDERAEPGLAGRCILVVDDDADFATALKDLLESEDCDAETAAGPDDLISLRPEYSAEVVLLDIQLNRVSGIELMSEIHTRWPHARIIVMTGFASKETAIQALRNGAVGYLEKPINAEELHATISHALWAYDAEITMLRTQEQLKASLHKAEAANRSKSLFLANMSHELRTPLNAILGFSEVMKNEHFGPLSADLYMEYVGNIHESGRHLLSIVDSVLDFSQTELDPGTLSAQPVVLEDLVKETCSMVSDTAEKCGITLRPIIPQELPCLNADRGMVRQMLTHLVGNAVKFTEEGGRVTVTIAFGETGEFRIAVEDTGVGIPADRVEEMIEPFSIADPMNSRSHGGVGLGLTITKQMVELHGGRLELRSERNVGTTATLVFPAGRPRIKSDSMDPGSSETLR